MFNSPILDLVIMLSFTYFIGSLLLSSINEAIAGWLRLRPKQLKKALEGLFFEDGWKNYIRNSFIKTPTMQSLMKDKGRYPAYISSENFVQAIVCELNINHYTPALLMQELKDNTRLPKHFKELLINIYAQSQGSISDFEKRLQAFYNNTMDRATGWYKRKIRFMLFILGFVLALALNIDTLKISSDALADKQRLSKAVDNIAANLPRLDSLRSVKVTDTSVEVSRETVQKEVMTAKLEFQQTTSYGWGYIDFKKEWKENFWSKLIGILITTFALQLGSNYWFDIINKAVNIRATGKKPDEKQKEDSTAKPTT